MYLLHSFDAFSLDSLVVAVSADRAGIARHPHEVKMAAIAGPVRTLGGKLEIPASLLIRITAHRDCGETTLGTRSGRATSQISKHSQYVEVKNLLILPMLRLLSS